MMFEPRHLWTLRECIRGHSTRITGSERSIGGELLLALLDRRGRVGKGPKQKDVHFASDNLAKTSISQLLTLGFVRSPSQPELPDTTKTSWPLFHRSASSMTLAFALPTIKPKR